MTRLAPHQFPQVDPTVMVAALPTAACLLDAYELRVVAHNQLYQSFLDEPYHTSGVMGLRLEEFLPEAEESGLLEMHRRAAGGQFVSVRDFLCRGFPRGGRYWDVHLAPIRTEEGRVGWVLATLSDVTERKRAERQLRKLSRAVEQSPSTIVITDAQGAIEYVNPKFTKLTGYTFEEALGQNPRILKTDKTPPETHKNLWRTITSGAEWQGEFCNKKKNGELYWESASISPIRNSQGIITHFVAVKEDITARKLTEEALRESEERYRQLFENANDAILVHGLEPNGMPSKFIEVNDVACRRLGYSRDELLAMSPADIDAEEHRHKVPEIKEGSLKQGHSTFEGTHVAKNGREIPVEINSHVFTLGDRKVVLSIARDITERKKAEETIRRLAYQDALTGLPNRVVFNDRLALALALARRRRERLAIMMLDVDHFKVVNDTLGHSVGDKVLQGICGRLSGLLRESDTAARMGGDEFILLLPDLRRVEDAVDIAQRIIEALDEPFELDGHEIRTTVSIGIAIFPQDGELSERLVVNADIAMYQAKRQGGNRYHHYAPADTIPGASD
ncbi:MAG: PAS domain S-box protein [Chloroflexi bacterium]|nr:PAS domain S-box protein [Chloroflexota bacterium]